MMTKNKAYKSIRISEEFAKLLQHRLDAEKLAKEIIGILIDKKIILEYDPEVIAIALRLVLQSTEKLGEII